MKQISKIHQIEEIIKKSTFISIVGAVHTPQDVDDFLTTHTDANASHHCWAYKIQQSYRFNDDGEPSGTAGKPILNAITGQGFDNTIALVIRYYGGIKLGTGGLMRAYGGGASRCLQGAETEIIQDLTDIQIMVPFAYIQAIHNLSKKLEAQITSEDFNEQGALINVNILTSLKSSFEEKAINLSKGQIKLITGDD